MSPGTTASGRSRPIRRALASLLIIAGVLAASAAVFTWTSEKVYFDEDRFVEAFDGLESNEDLRERVAEGIAERILLDTVELYETADQLRTLEDLEIEAEVAEDDDDPDALVKIIQAERLAVINEVTTAIVNQADFADAFSRGLPRVHEDLIEAIEDESEVITEDTGEVFMNFASLLPDIQSRLAAEDITSDIANVELSRNVARFKVVDRTAAFSPVWRALAEAPRTNTLIFGALAALVLAVLISDRRPWVLITFGAGVASISVLVIVFVYVAWALVPLFVETSSTSGLIASVYQSATSPLVRNEVLVVGLGVALALVGSIARWVFPDDWVYEHHDDGMGPMAVKRSRRGSKGMFPQQQQPQYPGQYPQQYPGQYGQQYPQQFQGQYGQQAAPGFGYQLPAGPAPEPEKRRRGRKKKQAALMPGPAESQPMPFERSTPRTAAPLPDPPVVAASSEVASSEGASTEDLLPTRTPPTAAPTEEVEAAGWDYDAGDW